MLKPDFDKAANKGYIEGLIDNKQIVKAVKYSVELRILDHHRVEVGFIEIRRQDDNEIVFRLYTPDDPQPKFDAVLSPGRSKVRRMNRVYWMKKNRKKGLLPKLP